MRLLERTRTAAATALTATAVGVAISGCALFGNASTAAASSGQVALLEVPNIQGSDPSSTLQKLRNLGVNMIRVEVIWSSIAPDPKSRTRPNFNASNPASYPAANWAPYDRVVNDARADGIAVDLMPTGGAPLWATASGAPRCSTVGGSPVCFQNDFKPSASAYGQFVHAVATRYRSVHFWELWNEINWGPALTPQYYHSSVPVAAKFARNLLNAGWNSLRQTGHSRDTIVTGSLSQDGSAHVGQTGTSAPLILVRTLYCVNSSYRHLTGAAARQAGCPTSKSGYRRFRAKNPALFRANGIGVHPYPYGKPPTKVDYPNPNGVEFAEIPHLITTLNRVQRVYGSRKRLSAFNTEFGYQPGYTSAQNAAKYINWAEYLSYKNSRIGSYDQYELQDVSWFKTGLLSVSGHPKPSFYAYRLPVFLPTTRTRRGRTLQVWGDARPAHLARADGHGTQYMYIQFSRGGRRRFSNLKRVRITNSRGYINVRVRFPSSGVVRLAWEYPANDSRLYNTLNPGQRWIYSRTTSITLH